MNHTTGTWRTSYQQGRTKILCDGKTIATVGVPAAGIHELNANAKLIAAAPELLKALRIIIQAIDSDPSCVRYFDLRNIEQAKNAINKATV